jgi:cellulose biosynthesis protein BcsQ
MVNISFFSYKGGAGRTSLLFNTLPFLAENLRATEKEPIVVIDLDLDSKGLSYIVEKASGINAIQVLRGDSAIGFRQMGNIGEHPFFSKLIPIGAMVGLPASLDRSILFVSAHAKEGAKYLTENGNNYDDGNISLSVLNKICRNFNCKAIVMDSPAGNQLTAEKSLSIANKIVLAMRITRQFRKGSEEFLKEKSFEFSGKEYIIVPNAVPKTDGTAFDINNIMSNIALLARNAIGKSGKLNLKLLENGRTGVNEVNLFKFKEESLKKESIERTLLEDELNAVGMYKLLAEELANENS